MTAAAPSGDVVLVDREVEYMLHSAGCDQDCPFVELDLAARSTSMAESTTTQERYSRAMPVTIYHNPKCTKSRQTLELLRERGLTPKVVEYLKTPPDVKELEEILKKLGMEPRELMRTKEDAFKEAGLGDPKLTRKQLVAALAEHPILIERPIVVNGAKAAIGRPPENVLKIL